MCCTTCVCVCCSVCGCCIYVVRTYVCICVHMMLYVMKFMMRFKRSRNKNHKKNLFTVTEERGERVKQTYIKYYISSIVLLLKKAYYLVKRNVESCRANECYATTRGWLEKFTGGWRTCMLRMQKKDMQNYYQSQFVPLDWNTNCNIFHFMCIWYVWFCTIHLEHNENIHNISKHFFCLIHSPIPYYEQVLSWLL